MGVAADPGSGGVQGGRAGASDLPRAALTTGPITQGRNSSVAGRTISPRHPLASAAATPDDSLPGIWDAGVFVVDPFTSFDVEGVGGLIRIAASCRRTAHRTVAGIPRGPRAWPGVYCALPCQGSRSRIGLAACRSRSWQPHAQQSNLVSEAPTSQIDHTCALVRRRIPGSGQTPSGERVNATRRSGAPSSSGILPKVSNGYHVNKIQAYLDKNFTRCSGYRALS